MRYIFNFPDIGEGLDEGTVVEWYVSKGQSIKSGDPLVRMETDKVVTDIPSPKAGVVVAIYGKVGEIVPVGSPLVEVEIEGVYGADAVIQANENTTEPVEEAAGVVGTLEVAGNNAYLPSSNEGINESAEKTVKSEKKVISTPIARAMAKDLKVNINNVAGTGPAGRVTTADVKKHFDEGKYFDLARTVPLKTDVEKVIYEPLTSLRKTIAKNMILSKQMAAHMTIHEEVEIEELVRVREKFKAQFAEKKVKLTYLSFILKALVYALKKYPYLNSQMDIENNRMIIKKYYNIGIAVDTPEGLVVPVIHDVDKLSLFEIAEQLQVLSEKANSRKLTMEDLKDGTFTVTNYGSIGGIYAVPVINYPQAAILGIGRILKKPVVKNDTVVPGMVLPLSLSVDHRIVDGGEATRFINTFMLFLEEPVSLILE